MAKIKLLTARQINTLPVGFHADGGNLYLRVRDNCSRAWVFRYKIAGKATEIGLGAISSRSLLEAREIAGGMRSAIINGRNPITLVKVKRDGTVMTFKDCALALIESKRSGWRSAQHTQQWENTLAQYAYPSIGNKKPADVTLTDVKAILLSMWATKTETASRLRQRIEAVLDYASVHDDDQNRSNPARWKGVLDKVLPAARKVTKKIHYAAIRWRYNASRH